MRILFATADRDLNASYRDILEQDLGQTVTAFDGTQVLDLLLRESFDLVILDRNLPRIENAELIEQVRRKGIPLFVLTDEPASVRMLTQEPLPSVFLAHPFTPQQMETLVSDVSRCAESREKPVFAGLPVDLSGFCFESGPGLTLGEIRLLTGRRIKDVTSGYRAVGRRSIAAFAENYPIDYPEPEAIVDAVMRRERIREIPVVMRNRKKGKSSITPWRSVYYMIKVTLDILICRISYGLRRDKNNQTEE